jgi:hypothetical protein
MAIIECHIRLKNHWIFGRTTLCIRGRPSKKVVPTAKGGGDRQPFFYPQQAFFVPPHPQDGAVSWSLP